MTRSFELGANHRVGAEESNRYARKRGRADLGVTGLPIMSMSVKNENEVVDISSQGSQLHGTEDAETGQMNRSALRAASLLVAVGEYSEGVSAAELALKTGIPRPTAFRILLSLVHTGLLSREGGSFKLGWRTAQLGRLADPYRDILPRIQAILDHLAGDINESIEFSMFTGPATQETIAQASSGRLLAPTQQYVGQNFPLHATATGKILLANLTEAHVHSVFPGGLEALTPATITDRQELATELEKIRYQGFATLDSELEEGLYVVAVPVRNGEGKLVAGLSVSGLSQRMQVEGVQYVEKLREAAILLAEIVSPAW